MTEVVATLTLTDFLLARIAEDEFYAENFCHERESGQDPCPKCRERALAECEAKRRIVESYAEATRVRDEYRTLANPEGYAAFQAVASVLWAQLAWQAAIYSDHPDYREEWKPPH